NPARADRVHPHVVWGAVQPELLREPEHAVLGRDVGIPEAAWKARYERPDQPSHRSRVYDRASPLLLHLRQPVQAAVEDPARVYGDYLVPAVLRSADPGVVHENIHPAPSVDGRPDRRSHIFLAARVRPERSRFAPGVLDLRRDGG